MHFGPRDVLVMKGLLQRGLFHLQIHGHSLFEENLSLFWAPKALYVYAWHVEKIYFKNFWYAQCIPFTRNHAFNLYYWQDTDRKFSPFYFHCFHHFHFFLFTNLINKVEIRHNFCTFFALSHLLVPQLSEKLVEIKFASNLKVGRV